VRRERPDGLGLDARELLQANPADEACQAIANHRPADRQKLCRVEDAIMGKLLENELRNPS